MTTLANYMHSIGLGWFIKNPDDTGDSYAADMEPLADAVLTGAVQRVQLVLASLGLRGPQGRLQRRDNLSTANFCPADNGGRVQRGALPVDLTAGAEPLSLIRRG